MPNSLSIERQKPGFRGSKLARPPEKDPGSRHRRGAKESNAPCLWVGLVSFSSWFENVQCRTALMMWCILETLLGVVIVETKRAERHGARWLPRQGFAGRQRRNDAGREGTNPVAAGRKRNYLDAVFGHELSPNRCLWTAETNWCMNPKPRTIFRRQARETGKLPDPQPAPRTL